MGRNLAASVPAEIRSSLRFATYDPRFGCGKLPQSLGRVPDFHTRLRCGGCSSERSAERVTLPRHSHEYWAKGRAGIGRVNVKR